MIIESEYGNINFFEHANLLPKNKIAISFSSGADSSLIFYLLCKVLNDPESGHHGKSILPIHFKEASFLNSDLKVASVINFMKSNFPDVNILDTYVSNYSREEISTNDHHNNVCDTLFDDGTIDLLLSGNTMYAPFDIRSSWNINGPDPALSDPNRDEVLDVVWDGRYNYFPFRNKDKRFIAEQYAIYELTDTLFPLTYSCVNVDASITLDGTRHCGSCYWCSERQWAFSRLI